MGRDGEGHGDSDAIMRETEESRRGTSSQPCRVEGRYRCENDEVM